MRNIRLWLLQGMPMSGQVIEGQRTRVVEKEIFLAHFDLHLKQNPVHQQRMRARRRTAAEAAAQTPEDAPVIRRLTT